MRECCLLHLWFLSWQILREYCGKCYMYSVSMARLSMLSRLAVGDENNNIIVNFILFPLNN